MSATLIYVAVILIVALFIGAATLWGKFMFEFSDGKWWGLLLFFSPFVAAGLIVAILTDLGVIAA